FFFILKPPFNLPIFLALLHKKDETTFCYSSIITKKPPAEIDDFFAPHAKILKVPILTRVTTAVI
ncbi:hypothetical protein, partial [Enterococcus faecalis]